MRQAMNAVHMLKSSLQSPAPIEKTARPPAGRVRLMSFVLDGRSEASLNSCFSHLSISNATIKRGGIARALEYLSVERSPETIIVDIAAPICRHHRCITLPSFANPVSQ